MTLRNGKKTAELQNKVTTTKVKETEQVGAKDKQVYDTVINAN